ncbi:MAG: type II toxin-antitoxin system VapC family toxin [Pyrinomonadaceae bacterium]
MFHTSELFITDFAFHSICVIMTRLKKEAFLLDFAKDTFIDGAVTLVSVLPEETQSIVDAMGKFGLDFDDAYQYIAAEKNDLTIVSFDNDLKGTPRGKQTPAEVIASL